MSSTKRASLALVLFVGLVISAVSGVFSAAAPPPAPAEIRPGEALAPRLSQHVLLVIVDGLRYDVATDPNRMPHFAMAMRRWPSGEIWAGRVLMTTSAVLSLGTGQRGRLEQILRNLRAEPPPHNSWLENAARAGLELSVAGDPAWSQLYGKYLAEQRLDPEGVAIDVDFNPQTFQNVRALIRARPDFLVAHFVTPDHQGHAYGIRSPRYAAHMRDFDRQLSEVLSGLDASWTVVVTSDHGAADSGTHGTDAPIQRRSPIYAFGPGLTRSQTEAGSFEQLDLSATLPVLLGVPPPAHGVGRVLVEWLDLLDTVRAQLACAHAARVSNYANSLSSKERQLGELLAPCSTTSSEEAKLAAASSTVRAADEIATRVTGLASARTSWSLVAIGLFGVALLLLLSPRRELSLAASGAALLAISVFLVVTVERLPGIWPNVVRAGLFVAANLVLLALWIRPAILVRRFELALPFAALIAPGLLVLSYPANTRPQSVAVCAVLAILYGSGRLPIQAPGSPVAGATRRPYRTACALALSLLALLPIALRENATYSGLLLNETLRRAVVSAVLACWLFWFRRELGLEIPGLALVVALALLPIWLRPVASALAGRSSWLLLACAFGTAWVLGRSAWAVLFGVLSVLWISRDFEAVPLLAVLSMAWVAGRRLCAAGSSKFEGAELLLAALLGFALLFALRIGLQDGLEFGGLDWAAGAFDDPGVSPLLIGIALVYKYAAGAVLVGLALTHSAGREHARHLLRALALCFVVRTLSLCAMFFVAGQSYWTGLRVLGDLPTALAMGFGCLLAYFASMLPRAERRVGPLQRS